MGSKETSKETGTRGEIPRVGKFLVFTYNHPTVGKIEGEETTQCKPNSKNYGRYNFTAFDLATVPPTLMRRDYSLEQIRQLGGKVPPFYFDELGNLRGEKDELIFQAPDAYIERDKVVAMLIKPQHKP